MAWRLAVLVGAVFLSRFACAGVSLEQLLRESGLTLTTPAEFVSLDPQYHPTLPYEAAFESLNGNLQIRYSIRPLSRIKIDYNDPHNAAPNPNHIFPLVFQSLISGLASTRNSPSSEFPPEQAQSEFNADWAAAATLDVTQEYGGGYSQALLVAIHKNALADAYISFLFNDFDKVRQEVQENLHNLKFMPSGTSQ